MSSAGGAAISGSEGKGVVEIVVRSVVAVFAFAALVAAAVAVGTFNDVFGTGGSGGLGGDTRGASGWIIFVALAAIAIMALFILLRIAGRGSTIIMAVGIVFSILLGLGYFAGGVAAAKFADDWDDVIPILILSPRYSESELRRIMSSLAAAAAFCFFSDVVLVGLVIVSILKK